MFIHISVQYIHIPTVHTCTVFEYEYSTCIIFNAHDILEFKIQVFECSIHSTVHSHLNEINRIRILN